MHLTSMKKSSDRIESLEDVQMSPRSRLSMKNQATEAARAEMAMSRRVFLRQNQQQQSQESGSGKSKLGFSLRGGKCHLHCYLILHD